MKKKLFIYGNFILFFSITYLKSDFCDDLSRLSLIQEEITKENNNVLNIQEKSKFNNYDGSKKKIGQEIPYVLKKPIYNFKKNEDIFAHAIYPTDGSTLLSDKIEYIKKSGNLKIATIYGEFDFECLANLPSKFEWLDKEMKLEIIKNLFQSDFFLRMAFIDQGGPGYLHGNSYHFSRLEHMLGVAVLLYKTGRNNFEEIIAGLTHDVSHSVFSHLADVIFGTGHSAENAYQDSIHMEYLRNNMIPMLEKIGISKNNANTFISEINPDLYHALDSSIPDLCADRLQYLAQTACAYGDWDKDDVRKNLAALNYGIFSYFDEKEKIIKTREGWYYDNSVEAKKMADLAFKYMRRIYNASWNFAQYHIYSVLLKYLFNKNDISRNDFFGGRDDIFLKKIIEISEKDKYVRYILYICNHMKDIIKEVDKNDDLSNKNIKMHSGKFRGINPYVVVSKRESINQCKRLTEIDIAYDLDFDLTRVEYKKGIHIEYLVPVTPEEFHKIEKSLIWE